MNLICRPYFRSIRIFVKDLGIYGKISLAIGGAILTRMDDTVGFYGLFL